MSRWRLLFPSVHRIVHNHHFHLVLTCLSISKGKFAQRDKKVLTVFLFVCYLGTELGEIYSKVDLKFKIRIQKKGTVLKIPLLK